MLHVGVQMVLALGAVIAVMAVLAKLARRGLRGGANLPVLQVLTRQQLSKGCYLAVVRVGEGYQVIAVSPGGVTRLAELDPATVNATATPAGTTTTPVGTTAVPGPLGLPGTGSFGERWVAQLRELTIRRR